MDITGVTFTGGITVTTTPTVGKLYAWGYNGIYGQLGFGDLVSRYVPTQLGADVWTRVASGKNGQSLFSGAIRQDGTLWTWGNNASGALGQGSYSGNNCSSPVQVGALTTWQEISLGTNCGFAIKTNGTLWAWGDGSNGQLGLNNQSQYASPKQVGALTNWKQIEGTASRATFAVKTDGTLWSWGNNFNGQLGLNTAGAGTNRSSPVQVGTLTDWAQVAGCDGEGAMAVKTDGTLWGWGRNTQGQLAQGDLINRSSPVQIGTLNNWAQVAVATQSSLVTAAVKTDGTLWTWGPGGNMLGQGAISLLSSPVQVGTQTNWARVCCGRAHMLAVKTDGTLWAWGSNSNGQLGIVGGNLNSPVQVGVLTDWRSDSVGVLAGGWAESFAVTKIAGIQAAPISLNTVTGTAPPVYQTWTWGDNAYGQLGTNNTTTQSSPVQVSSVSPWGVPISKLGTGINVNHVIKTDGTLWGVGANDGGQLGIGTEINYSSPVQVGADTTWTDIADYYRVAAGIKSNGALYTWGSGNNGALGLNNNDSYSSPVQVGTDTNWQKISLGFRFGVAVKNNGTLWSWGYNSRGQLGQNNTVDSSSPTQVGTDTNWASARATDQFVVAIKTDGTLWSWGNNSQGCLGQNTSYINCSSPVQIGTDTNWATVGMGGDFVIATKTNGTLWAWGTNAGGKLGINSSNGQPVSSPVQIGSDTNWIQAGAGLNQGMAMKNDGTVWTWGSNDNGCLGLNLATSPSAKVSSPVQIGSGSWSSMFPTRGGAELIKIV